MGGNETNLPPLLQPFAATHVILSVRGPLPHGGGFAYFYPISYGTPDRATFDPAVTALTQFLAEALERYPIDPARLFIAGFSQGAIMGMTLSLATPMPIKGVIAMSGYIPSFVKAGAPEQVATAYFVSQGERDPIFGVTVGRETAAFLRSRSVDVTYREEPIGHEVSPSIVHAMTEWLRERS
jgi:phospholipase/carboxylesterase